MGWGRHTKAEAVRDEPAAVMRESSLAEKGDHGDGQARHHEVPWECTPGKDDPTWHPGPPAEDVEAEYHDGAVRARNEALHPSVHVLAESTQQIHREARQEHGPKDKKKRSVNFPEELLGHNRDIVCM